MTTKTKGCRRMVQGRARVSRTSHTEGLSGGTCGGSPLGCNDGDPCTADSCDAQDGCAHTDIPGCVRSGGGTLCTLTQGAYGSPGGIANGNAGWITNNLGVLPISIGAPGTGSSVTINTKAGLIAFMPTGG